MLFRRGRYTAELLPRRSDVPREQDAYRVVISDKRGQPLTDDCLIEIYVDGLEAAKIRAEELLNLLVEIDRDAIPESDSGLP